MNAIDLAEYDAQTAHIYLRAMANHGYANSRTAHIENCQEQNHLSGARIGI